MLVNDKKKTIYGVSHITDSSIILIKNGTFPLIKDSNHKPFVTTKNETFSMSLYQVQNMLINKLWITRLHKWRSKISYIFFAGLFLPVISLLIALFNDADVNLLWRNPLFTLGFVLGVWGFAALVYDSARKDISPDRLAEYDNFTEEEYKKKFESIEASGIDSDNKQLIYYLSDGTLDFFEELKITDSINFMQIMQKLIQSDNEVINVIERLGIKREALLSDETLVPENVPSSDLNGLMSLIFYAFVEAVETDSETVEPVHLFSALVKILPALEKAFQKSNISHTVVREVVNHVVNVREIAQSMDYFNPDNAYLRTGGLAREWIYGYTFILDKFSRDLTQEMAYEQAKFGIGHESEVENLAAIVGRVTEKNALLIGKPGVGKSSIVLGLAQQINRRTAPEQLLNKRIIKLDVNGLIAYAHKDQNLEETISNAMNELSKAGNTVLYIDEMQELIPATGEASGRSVASILLPYILESNFPIIGTVNDSDYKKYFENNSFRQSFTNVEVSELSIIDTLKILESQVKIWEKNYSIYITFPALVKAAELSKRYITDRLLPDSAVRVVEASCGMLQQSGKKILTADDVANYISLQTKISVSSVSEDEASKLLKLEENIRRKVIGQEKAISSVVNALRRARTDLRDPDKPIGVFLFIGPTGVGKTYLAKAISTEYFDSKDDIVRVDMSEYKDPSSIDKLLGTMGSNAHNATTLLDKIKSNPYTVVLFDEIEKAHSSVLDLFLQLFDEGRLTNSAGETVDFTNTIIICTSNIGSQNLLTNLEKNFDWGAVSEQVITELKGAIRPELYNRFDDIIVFTPHSIENLTKIAELLLNSLKHRVADKGLTLTWQVDVPRLLAEKSYNPALGARPLRRYIQETLEARLATEMLQQKTQAGDQIIIEDDWIA